MKYINKLFVSLCMFVFLSHTLSRNAGVIYLANQEIQTKTYICTEHICTDEYENNLYIGPMGGEI